MRALLLAAGLLLTAACSDPTSAPDPVAPPTPAAQALACSADIRDLQVRCSAHAPALGGARSSIVGGQGVNVRLTSSNVAYDSAAGVFRFDVTLQNLMAGRTLGTYDGTGVAGIRVFFATPPTTTLGEGQVAILNGDGTDLFLSADEAFYSYAALLPPDAETAARQWRFAVPASVNRFGFNVYVEAPVWDGTPPPDPVHGVFRQMTAGSSHSCGLTDDGRIFCWGDASRGQLGHDGSNLFLDPVQSDHGRVWRTVSAGGEFTCAVSTEDEGSCWGYMGNAPASGAGSLAVDSLDAGGGSACALSGGAAYCWGDNQWGQLGVGDQTRRGGPAPVAGGHAFVDVRVGGRHTCALTSGGEAWCWGMNFSGQLGATVTETCGTSFGYPCSTVPVRVDTELRFARIDAGFTHTCALTAEGAAYCWGANAYRQVGSGSTADRVMRPEEVARDERFTRIFALARGSCGLDADGVAECWGTHPNDVTQSLQDVVAGQTWRSIAGDDTHMCLAALDGQGFCAGREQFGELGNLGSHQNSAHPRAALAPLHLFDLPPRAGFDHGGSPYAEVTFSAQEDQFHRNFATYSDDDFGIALKLWSFGDGATAEGTWVKHVYAANGTYTVTLTVVDNAGQRAMLQRTVTVSAYP